MTNGDHTPTQDSSDNHASTHTQTRPSPVNRTWQTARQGLLQEARQNVMQEIRAQSGDYVLPSRRWFEQLPGINRHLLGSGALCIGLGLFCLVGVPLLSYANSATQAAIFPFTAEGKRQTCLSHLQRMHQALAQYRDDHDTRLPVAEYSSKGERRTWTAALHERGVESESFVCPTGRGESDGRTISDYGFNPILFGQAITEERADKVVLLADRGTAHDTILLPPFATWPAAPKDQSSKDQSKTAAPGNFDFRHGGEKGSGQSAVLYADGHADSLGDGDWTMQAVTWGGERVFTVGMQRLEAQHPVLRQIPTSAPGAFKNQKAKLRQALGQLHIVQKEGLAHGSASETVEKRLWKGARTLRVLGDAAFEKQLHSDLGEYSRQLLGQAGKLKPLEDEGGEGLSFTLRYPESWSVETRNEGRYRTTYFHSPSPYVEVMLERGERNQPTAATLIDWSGMESSFKKKYSKAYKRIRMGYTTLGGQTVSLWECELQKADGPRLRKRYLGHSTDWYSTILVCTAPANSFGAWNPVFDQMQASFEFRE